MDDRNGVGLRYEQQRSDYTEAMTWVGRLMVRTPAASLSSPTPCTDFDVRRLMSHLVGTARRGLAVARHQPTRDIAHVVTDVPDDQLATYYSDHIAPVADAWVSLAHDAQVRAPWGDCSACVAVRGFTIETLTHGWDLAQATSQDRRGVDDVAERCLTGHRSVIASWDRGAMYAPAVRSESPFALDRMAHLLGRSDAWRVLLRGNGQARTQDVPR